MLVFLSTSLRLSHIDRKVKPMQEFSFEHLNLLCRGIIDEDAPKAAKLLANSLGSNWLSDLVLATHQLADRQVVLCDHVNLVLALEYPQRKLATFLLAELEFENKLARLHVIYTLRGYRKTGLGAQLLTCFDQVLIDSEYQRVICAPTSHRSVSLFQKHSQQSELDYELSIPEKNRLDRGELESELA